MHHKQIAHIESSPSPGKVFLKTVGGRIHSPGEERFLSLPEALGSIPSIGGGDRGEAEASHTSGRKQAYAELSLGLVAQRERAAYTHQVKAELFNLELYTKLYE